MSNQAAANAAIANRVKLVVWDLDETFWQGTLSEEGIVPVSRNIERVIALSQRGIISSICSKNDEAQAKSKLVELGIWDYFVFPSIGFNPKGKAVAEMIEGAALRAENVLFIDDNPSNLEEVKFFNPGIMACHPQDVLDELLDNPNLAGKPDPGFTRLNQYKFLQCKVEERAASSLSNEEFLRASNIRVTIDYDIDSNFDRIVDLLNRANQLNYTKKRLARPKDIAAFRAALHAFGVHAGCVHAADAYGDYGLIGFFMLKRRFNMKKLIHFVFSCRTMNMGIEQYIHESLDRPEIDIVEPVSYGLASHATIDWINRTNEDNAATAHKHELLLLGGCDLLQLASYCSSNRREFVNTCQNGAMIRFDDPGFITDDRTAVRNSKILGQVPCWQYQDVVKFDEGAASADLILISMWPAMNAVYLRTKDGVELSLSGKLFEDFESTDSKWVAENLEELKVLDDAKTDRVLTSFDTLACKSQGQIFVLGCYTRGEESGKPPRRKLEFNAACREYCQKRPARFRYIDFDSAVCPEHLVGAVHFSRAGYFALARHILDLAAAPPDLMLAS